MINTPATPPLPPAAPVQNPGGCRRFGWALLALFVLLIAGGWWFIRHNLNARPFKAVVLTVPEQQVLEKKMAWVDSMGGRTRPGATPTLEPTPEAIPPLVAKTESRLISLSEKELNSFVPTRSEFKEINGNIRFDLEENSVAIEALCLMPGDVPLVGGKNVRFSARAKGGYENGRLHFTITSITAGGIEVPNAWVEHLKGRDLGAEWMAKTASAPEKSILDGIESIRVGKDRLDVKLKP